MSRKKQNRTIGSAMMTSRVSFTGSSNPRFHHVAMVEAKVRVNHASHRAARVALGLSQSPQSAQGENE